MTEVQAWAQRGSSLNGPLYVVLLQITLTWLIMLGYLLTESNETLRSLDGVVNDARNAVRQVQEKPPGIIAREKVQVQKNQQLLQLLTAWLELRPDQPIFKDVPVFSDPKRVKLPAQLQDLPSEDPRYEQFRLDIQRVYGSRREESAKRVTEEVARLLALTVQRSKLKPPEDPALIERIARFDKAAALQREAADIFFDPKKSSTENLQFVAQKIRQDLEAERQAVVALQFRLVIRVAESGLASPKYLATGPSSGALNDPNNVGVQEVLREIVDELEAPLGLLPEVTERLHSIVGK